jgi:hypothetical protein
MAAAAAGKICVCLKFESENARKSSCSCPRSLFDSIVKHSGNKRHEEKFLPALRMSQKGALGGRENFSIIAMRHSSVLVVPFGIPQLFFVCLACSRSRWMACSD